MKIAIIGGGISGLATYLQFRKHINSHSEFTSKLEITIFESHDLKKYKYDTFQAAGLPSVGGGYGLAANGMMSLRRLDPNIHDKILWNSFPSPRFQCRTRTGRTLGAINTVIDGKQGGGAEACCMVTREVVLEALYTAVPETAIRITRVVEVVDAEDEVVVRFEGEAEETFDLVVGADGIWSRTRRAISGDELGPEYRGLSTLGGFIEPKHLQSIPTDGPMPYPLSQTIMTFGHNGFLGYTPCNAGRIKITEEHIRGQTALPPGDMGFWWARSAHEDPKAEPNVEQAKADLAEKMESWRDPSIRRILQHSLKTSMIPTYALPKQKTWTGKRVVLVGDAAHALPTSSGQGVSQSLEDAEALAMLLAHHLTSVSESAPPPEVKLLQKVFEQYMAVRKAHVEKILDAGNRGGDISRDLNFVAEYMMYAFFWIMLKFFGNFFTKDIENYDVVKEVEQAVK